MKKLFLLIITIFTITNVHAQLPNIGDLLGGNKKSSPGQVIMENYLNGGVNKPINGGQDRNPVGITGISGLGLDSNYIQAVQQTDSNLDKIKTMDEGLNMVRDESKRLNLKDSSVAGYTKGTVWEDLYRRIMANVVGTVSIIIFAMIIYGGFMYFTAGVSADTKKGPAGLAIIYTALVGAFIMLFAYPIINFIISAINGF